MFVTLMLAAGYLGFAGYMVYAPQVVGNATGRMRNSSIDTPTPAWMVRYAGCLMLAMPLSLVALGWGVPAAAVGVLLAAGFHYLANRLWPV